MTIISKLNFLLVAAVIITSTLAYGTVHQPTIALFYLTVAIMALLWTTDCWLSGSIRFSRSPLQLPLVLFAGYALIQIIPFGSMTAGGLDGIPRTISQEPFATEQTAIHVVALSLFFSLMLVYLDTAARMRKLVTIILVFGFCFAFFAILQSVLSPTKIYGLYESRFATPFGSFVNRHNFAAYMEMAVSLPLGLLFVGAVARDKRLLYVTSVMLMGAALLLSGSRGGLISLLAEVLLLIIITTKSGKKKLVLKMAMAALLLGAVVGGAMFVGGDTSLTRFAETANSRDISTNRTQIWHTTLKVIENNLPLGAGIGAFAQAYTPFDTLSGLERVEQAHNDYLQLLADAGMIGFAIGVLFLFWFVRAGFKSTKIRNSYRRGIAMGAFAGSFAVLIHSLFDFVLHTTAISILFLALIAILVAAGRNYPDEPDEFEDSHHRRRHSGTVTPISARPGL